MTIVYYPQCVRHIGVLGLPIYEVLVINEQLSTGGFFGHTEIVWGYERAMQRAQGAR